MEKLTIVGIYLEVFENINGKEVVQDMRSRKKFLVNVSYSPHLYSFVLHLKDSGFYK